MKYIAKPNTWFDEGTEAVPIRDFWVNYVKLEVQVSSSVFRGIRNGIHDEHICIVDDFERL